MNEEKLMPCPFCGGKAKIVERPLRLQIELSKFSVSCTNCHISTKEHTGFETSAIVDWNRRTERKAKWLSEEGYHECSECGACVQYKTTYCPDCGRRMEEVF